MDQPSSELAMAALHSFSLRAALSKADWAGSCAVVVDNKHGRVAVRTSEVKALERGLERS